MKKLLLTLLIVFYAVPCLAFLGVARQGANQTATCTKDTTTLVMNQTSETDGKPWGANAIGQEIGYSSQWSLYSISLKTGSSNSSCVGTVRIGTSADLTSSYTEQWTGVSFAAGEWVELVSVDNDVYSASTMYYVGMIQTSGTCYTRADIGADPNNSYPNYNYRNSTAVWNMAGDVTDTDLTMKVFKCQ